jgi:gentisate 1,2-dioxygenase
MNVNDDDQLGRARVKDSAELDAYYAQLTQLDAGALWTVANKIEPWYPQPESVPTHWPYAKLRPLVAKALDLVNADDAGRRVVALYNPRRRDIAAAVGLLYTGLQIMGPGESMTAHRHQAAALPARGRSSTVRSSRWAPGTSRSPRTGPGTSTATRASRPTGR